MDRKMIASEICLEYIRQMNTLMKSITFTTQSDTFSECDCDVAWVKQLYNMANAQETLLNDELYVRKLCLLDSLIGLSYFEKGSYENARQYAYLIEYVVTGEDSASNEARQRFSNSLQEIKADLEKTQQTKHKLIEAFLVNAEWLEESLKAENYSEEGLCSDLIRLYAKACENQRTLEGFGHRAMGGLMIDHESRDKLMDAPTPPPKYKPPLYLNT